ncbi:two-component regulator propeller domain-containing protein [Bacteroidota bacterium]
MNILKNIVSHLLLILIFSWPTLIISQRINYKFKHLTVEDGLSQTTIYCILQDSKGFMWFGTTDGLNKYNGYNFYVYNYNPLDSTTISGNSITELYEDSQGDIWIGTNEGILNRYNRKTETFDHYFFNLTNSSNPDLQERYYEYPIAFSRYNNHTITSIVEDDENHLWIGTWGDGLIYYNKKEASFIQYYNMPTNQSQTLTNRITQILKDKDGNIWIGTFNNGLIRLVDWSSEDKDSSQIELVNYRKDNSNDHSLNDNKIICLHEDKTNSLWVGTFDGGLNHLDNSQKLVNPEEAVFEIYEHVEGDNFSLSNNSVMSISEDKANVLWVGTFGGGLNQFNYKENNFHSYKNDPFDENSLADNDILSLYVDNSGILWIGTHLGKGLSKLEHISIKFGLLQNERGDQNSLNDDIIWSIYEDSFNNLWIGTYRGGLNLYDRNENKFTAYLNRLDDKNSLSNNHIRVIKEDYKGNLWIGTYKGGLNFYNRTTKKFTFYKDSSSNSVSFNQIQAIFIDQKNICWVGTFGGGLNKLDLNKFYETGETVFKKYYAAPQIPNSLSDNRIYSIFEDDPDSLWIGTFGGGLNRFDKINETFKSYRNNINNPMSLSDDRVLVIFQDSEGDLWIGTHGGGLNKFDKENEVFNRYSSTSGINSKVIYGILEDEKKNIWISTDNGLIKHNILTNNTTYYDLTDGLQSMEYSGGAYFKSQSGEMFFGGINGLNYFFPDSVRSNDYVPQIVVSDFKVFNEKIRGELEQIELSHDQNFFSFEFSALDYTDPNNNQYAYYLEGLENTWHYTDARLRIANYTNLEPGNYIFHVKGSNNDGVWNQNGLSIPVIILPPFWKTWWFVLISILSIGGLVSFLISMKVKHLLTMEKLKVRIAADLHDNVGAGLTEISILSEITRKEVGNFSKSAEDRLKNISETARKLVDNMSDIVWFVNPKRDSLHDLIIKLKDSYCDLLSDIGVSFRTDNIDNIIDIKLPMDLKQNLYLIFKEGINNSIKHSQCKKISLETRFKGNTLEMILKDDGIGLEESTVKAGNGLRNMKERAKSVRAKLDIFSEGGTIIKFTGKIGRQRGYQLN